MSSAFSRSLLRSHHRVLVMEACALTLLLPGAACTPPPRVTLTLEPIPNSSQLLIRSDAPVGTLRLWLPEGISSNEGFSSIYPVGAWEGDRSMLRQHVSPDSTFGPGNFAIRDHSVECAGIEVPRDQPVEWTASARVDGHRVRFEIRLRNLGSRPIRRAGAPICLKFADKHWWSPDHVHVRSDGRDVTLGQLGERAGKVPGFEAFLLAGRHLDNRFYHEFWGIHPNRLDTPAMISHHPEGWRVGITAGRAIILHSNRLNPCTDIMLDFGDLPPGKAAVRRGHLWIDRPRAAPSSGYTRPAGRAPRIHCEPRPARVSSHP